jgi:hypothetical protein
MSASQWRIFVLGIALAAPDAALAGPYTESGYDPSLMAAWATSVAELVRGPMDIANPSGGDASFGVPQNALGSDVGDNLDVVSLGDGGHITLAFSTGISDGPGDDFAVYENGFYAPGGLFAEFAFVEVSSNGTDFARFAATSLNTTPVCGGCVIDPTDYHNLGGKHPLGLGTGFDLAELAQHPLVLAGKLDLKHVGYVRLVDVIGDGSTLDAAGRPVYDPYPTPYASGGFDANGVGVLHLPEPAPGALFAAGVAAVCLLSRHRKPLPRSSLHS